MRLTISMILLLNVCGIAQETNPATTTQDTVEKSAPKLDPLKQGEKVPAGAVAIVNGDTIGVADFVEAIYQRYAEENSGTQALNDLIQIYIVEKHAKEQGIQVDATAIDVEYRRLEAEYQKAAQQNIEEILATTGRTQEEFRERLRISLLLQKLTQAEFKELDVAKDPSLTRQWLRQKQLDANIETSPDKLPGNAAARLYNDFITRSEFARNIMPKLNDKDVAQAIIKMMQLALIEKECGRKGLKLTPQRIEKEFERARGNFETNPRFEGLHFEDMVRQKTGLPASRYVNSADFRLETSLFILGESLVPDDAMKTEFEKDRDWYGPIHTIEHILLRGSDEDSSKGVLRSLKKSQEQCLVVLKRFESGEEFSDLVKMFSEDTSTKFKGGVLGVFTPQRAKSFPKISAALETMKVGEVRGPIPSKMGHHLIRLASKKPVPPISADIVRDVRKRRALAQFQSLWQAAKRGIDARSF